MANSEDVESEIPPALHDVGEKLRKGESPPSITVRELLGYFGSRRRGFYKVQEIKNAFRHLHITTYPDFEDIWIDGQIQFLSVPDTGRALDKGKAGNTGEGEAANGDELGNIAPSSSPPIAPSDPTFRIGALPAANQGVVSVKPDEPVCLAITRMLTDDYSQLPVMTTPREVKGMITWSSIGAGKAFSNQGSAVRHYMEKHHEEVRAEQSLFEVLPTIVERGYVLVRANGEYTGIVTASDVSLEFKQRTEPFLLLSEIEQHIRNLIVNRIPLAQIQIARNPADDERRVESISDLTLGECIRIFQVEEN
jgi:CBS domain-containing protein